MPDYLQRVLEESYKQSVPMIYKNISFDDEGRYWITSDGRLLSVCREKSRYKHFTDNGEGYYYTEIDNKKYYLHRLLALSFNVVSEKEQIIEHCEVHHLDFNRFNNSLDNLCILTPEKHKLIHTLWNRWQKSEVITEWQEQ